jgi:hydrogenase expression/formation protein HypC
MCVAVPGRVLEIRGEDGTRKATVDFDGVVRDVCLDFLPDLRVGEYAIVHAGFALERLDEPSATRTIALLRELGDIETTRRVEGP